MPNNPQTPPGPPHDPYGGAPEGFGPPVPPQQPSSGPAQQPPWGYGYPQQPAAPYQQQGMPPGYPQGQGYGPLQQNSNMPDWDALATERQAEIKRKRRMVIAGSVLGVLVLGAAAAFGIPAVTGGKAKPEAHGSPKSAAGSDTPSAPAGTSPSAGTSSPGSTSPGSTLPSYAPISAGDFFPAQTLTISGRTYTRVATNSTSPCWQASGGGLGKVLSAFHCTQMLRATYVSGGMAATVGVAVYNTPEAARSTDDHYRGQIVPLYGTGTSAFCHSACPVTHAAHGRFAYFSIAGPVSGAAGANDPVAKTAGHGVAGYALSVIMNKYGSPNR